MVLNYKNSYEITKTEDTYSFKTKFNIEYLVSFSEWENTVNELVIRNLTLAEISESSLKVGIDVRIGTTIEGVISDYFTNNPDVALIYVCDTLNQQEGKRYARFKRWFQNSEMAELILLEPPVDLIEQGFYFAVIAKSGDNEVKASNFMNKSIEDLTK